MTSLKSCFNIKLFWESFKQQKYIMILHTIFLFLVTALPVIILYNNSSLVERKHVYDDMVLFITGQNPVIMILLCAAAAMTAMWIFGYLYKHQSMQFYNSMPHTRECVYISRAASGALSLAVPLVLVYAVNTVIFIALGLSQYQPVGIMLASFAKVLMYYLCVYSVFCFAASISGNYFAQVLTVLIVFLGYLVATQIIYAITATLFNRLLIEFYYNAAYIFPPISLVSGYDYKDISAFGYVYCVLYTLVFFFLGLVLYKYRKSENTGKFFAYNAISVFLKYGISFFAALTVAAILASMSERNTVIIFIGYILGAFLSFIILQAIFDKNFKAMFSNMKNIAVFAAVICVVLAAPTIAPQLFEKMPSNIEKTKELKVNAYDGNGYNNMYTLKEKNNIAAVVKLMSYNDEEGNVSVRATVNPDNKLFSWTYSSSSISQQHFNEYLKNIYDTEEYKSLMIEKINVEKLGEEDDEYHWAELRKHYDISIDRASGPVLIKNIKAVSEALKNDYASCGYDDISASGVYCQAIFDGVTFNVYNCYTDTVKVIKENFADKIECDPADVAALEIFYRNDEKSAGAYKTEDKNQIKQILDSVFASGSFQAEISLTLNSGEKHSLYVNYEMLPSYVKNTIEKNK